MNKNELTAAVAEATGVSKKDTAAVIGTTLDKIADAMAAGDKVQLIGFGTFETRERGERTGKNPRTKETVKKHGDMARRNNTSEFFFSASDQKS